MGRAWRALAKIQEAHGDNGCLGTVEVSSIHISAQVRVESRGLDNCDFESLTVRIDFYCDNETVVGINSKTTEHKFCSKTTQQD